MSQSYSVGSSSDAACRCQYSSNLFCDTSAQKLIYSLSQLLPHGTKNKKWKREKKLKSKNGYAQKYRETVRGIRGVSPGEEKEGYRTVGRCFEQLRR